MTDYDPKIMEHVQDAHDRAAERLHGRPLEEGTTADVVDLDDVARAIHGLLPQEFIAVCFFYGATTAPEAFENLQATSRGYSQTEDHEAGAARLAQMLGGAFLLGSLTHAEFRQQQAGQAYPSDPKADS